MPCIIFFGPCLYCLPISIHTILWRTMWLGGFLPVGVWLYHHLLVCGLKAGLLKVSRRERPDNCKTFFVVSSF